MHDADYILGVIKYFSLTLMSIETQYVIKPYDENTIYITTIPVSRPEQGMYHARVLHKLETNFQNMLFPGRKTYITD